MKCKDAHGMMNAWVDGELSPDKRTVLELHLASCSACSAQAEELSRLTALLRTCPPDLPSAGLKEKTLSLFLKETGSKKVSCGGAGFGWGTHAAMMASVLIGLGIGCQLGAGWNYVQLSDQYSITEFLFSAGDLLSSWA